jgi:hypothetical protein
MSPARVGLILLLTAAGSVTPNAARADGTWTIETVGSGVIEVSLALDATGAPCVVFSSNYNPVYARRDAGGWTLDYLVTPSVATTADEEIAGAALIFYILPSLAFDPISNEPRIAYSRATDGKMWYAAHSPSGWTYDPIGPPGDRPSLAVDAAGIPHVAYLPHGSGPVYTVRTANSWNPEPIGFGVWVSHLRLDASGNPHVALLDSYPNSDMFYAERGPGGWSPVGVDTTGNTGFASLALDAAGEPHLSYLDRSDHALRYAERNGSTWTVETVAAPVGDECDNALALGPGGEPFIAYRESNAGELRFARRDGGQWSSEFVTAGSSAGLSCSMALDAAGRPHIAYYESSVPVIRYATRSPVLGVGPIPTVSGWGIERVSPNPARAGEAFDVALRMAQAQGVALELVDPSGRRVASTASPSLGAGLQTLRWDPGVSRAGLYFLRATFASGTSASTPLIILR